MPNNIILPAEQYNALKEALHHCRNTMAGYAVHYCNDLPSGSFDNMLDVIEETGKVAEEVDRLAEPV